LCRVFLGCPEEGASDCCGLEGFYRIITFQGINLGVSVILTGGHNGLAVWWQGSLGSGVPQIAMLVFIFAIFYFLLIMPQQRKQKKWQAMLSALKTGDKVTTSGGLRGTIISLKEDALTLRVPPDNLKLEVSRGSVVSVTTAEEGK
jgi:preprotein translocase subunit YajC